MNYKIGKKLSLVWKLSFKKGIDYANAKYELYYKNEKMSFTPTVEKIGEDDNRVVVEVKGEYNTEGANPGKYYLVVKDNLNVQLDKINAFELTESQDPTVWYGKAVNPVRTVDVDVEEELVKGGEEGGAKIEVVDGKVTVINGEDSIELVSKDDEGDVVVEGNIILDGVEMGKLELIGTDEDGIEHSFLIIGKEQ